MADDLLRHFEAEYEALRGLAAEFADAHPGAAAQLHLARGRTNDPHVERLLEGVAFLGARVRQRLDDEFPELTDALLGVLYPHYLAPFPSCMMAQFVAKPGLRAPATVPRHTMVETEAVDGLPCRFRTTEAVTVWPIAIEAVRLSGLPLPPLPVPLPRPAAGVLRITLACTDPGATIESLGLDTLRLHLANRQTAYPLYELLCGHVLAVAFADDLNDLRPVVRPGTAVQPAGFAPDEAILPWSARGFSGFRLLSEYFGFPDKFLSVDIGGIDDKVLAGAGRRMEIVLFLDHVPAHLQRAVGDDALALSCVPLVNLFPHRCEPIEMDWTRTEYRVDPDLRSPGGMEVWSIERVRESRLDGSERPWRPFFRTAAGDQDSTKAAAHYLPVWRPSTGTLEGRDAFLAIDDPIFLPAQGTPARLSVDALCTNRTRPRMLPSGDGQPHLSLEDGNAAVEGIVPIGPASQPLAPPPRGRRFWRLLSHLSLSHVSVVDGAEMLREVLRLYDLRDAPETRAVIASLIDVSSRPGVTRLPGARTGAFCRGLHVTLTFETAAWQGARPYLLGAIVERFLALHGTVNGFVQCSAHLQGRSEPVATWPARSGTRTLL